MTWLKIKPQHLSTVCCRIIGTDIYFSGAYDHIRCVWLGVNGGSYATDKVEWLDQTSHPTEQGDGEAWKDVYEIVMKHHNGYNYPKQAVVELQSKYSIIKT